MYTRILTDNVRPAAGYIQRLRGWLSCGVHRGRVWPGRLGQLGQNVRRHGHTACRVRLILVKQLFIKKNKNKEKFKKNKQIIGSQQFYYGDTCKNTVIQKLAKKKLASKQKTTKNILYIIHKVKVKSKIVIKCGKMGFE